VDNAPETTANPGAPLPDGEAMGALVRSIDWAQTPLGPSSSWSPTLHMMVRFLLSNRFPLLLWWGPHYCQIYNDAYRPILGNKHPRSMGQPTRECWSEIWDILQPLIDTPFHGGPPTWIEDLALVLKRHGFDEETHFTVAYSPVPDDTVASGIGGVLATVHEITEKVIGERRTRALRDLGGRALEAKSVQDACLGAADVLAKYPKDIPFALLYLVEPGGAEAHLQCAVGLEEGGAASPERIALRGSESRAPWPLMETLRTGSIQLVDDLAARFNGAVPQGPWPDPPRQAVVLPIRSHLAQKLAGFLVAGLSSCNQFDEAYRSFLELATTQIATGIANARAYEEERRRAEALAEIDRAKTAFFSNVSHEFRTPLTLMLGPLEEWLQRPDLAPEEQGRLALIHRNGLRLLKLVNSLLEFSRIEAGRARASYAPVDLGALTAELAGSFQSAIESTGVELIVRSPRSEEPAWVDTEMWEKIVLNLVSNAFKFTFEGTIEVALERSGAHWQLTVLDTGIGIEPAELPRIFERFHRVEGARGRSYEGSGIGLALVRELVRLHGGTVRAESAPNQGTRFIVSIPRGKEHLPADQVGRPPAPDRASTARAYVEEALRWLPDASASSDLGDAAGGDAATETTGAPRVLLADDNADLRDYVRRLLAPHYQVEAVADGEAALEAIRRRMPDLVLSDVMMPKLDGVGLLRALRADPLTRNLPVILLSARAGEESRVEGVELGADDYLVKPFSARELLARVGARVVAKTRRDAEQLAEERRREEERRKDEFLATLAHEMRSPLAPISNAMAVLDLHGSREPKAIWARSVVERQVAHLARLLDDLLDISRIAKNRLELRRSRFTLRQVVQQGLEASQPMIDAAKHTLTVSLPEEDVWLDADPLRISQVISNLLNNAAKYTPRGGQISLAARVEGEEVVLSVRDTGIGIESEFLPRAFDMFTQAAPALDQSSAGLGIGLALVRGIVEAHGGRVTARSAGPNLGSEFFVTLPRASTPERIRVGPGPTQSVPGGVPEEGMPVEAVPRMKILVADDNRDSADSLALMLQLAGHEVSVARDGEQAVAAAASLGPDVAILDIGMPKLNGYEAARRIRAEAWGKNIVLVALTGWGQQRDRDLAMDAGFDHHLVKPVEAPSLHELLRRAREREPVV